MIPARGGSKGVPRKNLRRVGGQTLVSRAVLSAKSSERIDDVVVSTDDDDIAAEAQRSGAVIVRRPAELASDTASSETALLHAVEEHAALSGHRANVLVFLQCTSPIIDPRDIDHAVAMVLEGGYDSVLSAVKSHAFIWRDEKGSAVGVNHDWRRRERRQDRPEEFRENGAIYVMRVPGFIRSGHRFFGRVGVCEVDSAHGIEVDDEDDLALAQIRFEQLQDSPLAELDPARVTALVTDFDGVHTDNLAAVNEEGTESVSVNRSDGLGLAALRRSGLPMLILSTERNPVVGARAQKLGIECVQGIDDKLSALRTWAQSKGIDPSGIVYVGNDSNDEGCLSFVGWPVIVADAHQSLRYSGALVTSRTGGAGALREIADRLLAEQGTRGWMAERKEFP